MRLSLASTHAVAAALLLAHACAPQHSTTVDASMPQWAIKFKRWIVSSMPKSKPVHAAAPTVSVKPQTKDPSASSSMHKPKHSPTGVPVMPIKPQTKDPSAKIKLEKLIAAHQNVVKVTNSGILEYFNPIPQSHVSFSLQHPFNGIEVNYRDANKEHIYAKYKQLVAQPQSGTTIKGIALAISKTPILNIAQALFQLPPKLVRHPSEFGIEEGYYTYEIYKGFQPSPDIVNFWVNFACQKVFDHYDSGFVQDEIQNLEIPAEAAIAEHFRRANGIIGKVRQSLVREDGMPSPIVVTNMIQYMFFDSFKSKIYGSKFPSASTQAIDTAAQILQTPRTGIHVLALLSLKRNGNDKGKPYTTLQIKATLHMALSGFILAQIKSYDRPGGDTRKAIPVVNSGNWGTGQFGNNLLMMALIQMVAACAAGVHFVAWAGNKRSAWERALVIFHTKIWPVDQLVVSTEELVRRIEKLGITWMP